MFPRSSRWPTRFRGNGRRRVAIGARHGGEVGPDRVVVAIGAEFLDADGESTEDEIAGVNHDGGASRRDAVLGVED